MAGFNHLIVCCCTMLLNIIIFKADIIKIHKRNILFSVFVHSKQTLFRILGDIKFEPEEKNPLYDLCFVKSMLKANINILLISVFGIRKIWFSRKLCMRPKYFDYIRVFWLHQVPSLRWCRYLVLWKGIFAVDSSLLIFWMSD